MTSIFTKMNSNSLALVLFPMIVVPGIFYNTTLTMVHIWTVNETFTHGFLVVPLSIWMIWQKRSQILLISPSPEPRLLVLLMLLLIVWLVSAAVDVDIIMQFCMISLILTTVWISAGRRIFLYIIFPLFFLYLSVPFGQVFIPYLMQYTANFTVVLIRMAGIPIYQDGLSFVLPTGSWSVVEECSGVRYLIASFTLGSIYAYLNYSSIKKRAVFILLSLVVPIAGNGLRAFAIVMIGHFSGMELAVGADHLLYGWVFFGVIIFLLFYAGSFWWDPVESLEVTDANNKSLNIEKKKYSPSSMLTITFLLMTLTLLTSSYIKSEQQEKTKTSELQLPVNFSNWQYVAGHSLNWQPVYLNPDVSVSRAYAFDEDFVQLNIAYYFTQRQGAEAISTSNKLTNPYGGQWKLISSRNVYEGDEYFRESELKYAGEKLLVWSWYRVGEYETPNPYIAKVLEAYNLIVEGRSDASLISIATQFNDTGKVTQKKLYDFWRASSEDISNQFEIINNEN